MNARAIMADLTRSGFALALDGERLLLSPSDRLDDRLRALIRDHKGELIALLQEARQGHPPPLTPDQDADIEETIAERAAILEFDGGLPRHQAEAQATRAMRVYRYRVTDKPHDWLVMIAPGCDLDEARRILIGRFGETRLIDVRESTP